MRIAGVCNIFGKLLIALSLCLLLPVPFSLYFGDGMERIFLLCAGTGAVAGGLLVALVPPDDNLGFRDGYAVVTLAWCGLALLGALPFYFCGQGLSLIDCWFESMSGFTTTGSTILSGLDAMPRAILLWRAITQWLGGMGMILLSIAILPLLGVGGMQLFKAETPGPVADKIRPRVRDTAARLWGIYTFFTAAETLCLMVAGLPLYDALCHSLTTLPGGGFSTHDASIAYFHSAAVDAIVAAFMLTGGINFVLYFRLLSGRWRTIPRESELKFFLLLFLSACTATVVSIRLTTYDHWGEAIRYGVFQVATCITTTGFATADYATWPYLPQAVLVLLMLTGAMAGSTSGAMKDVRVLLLFKQGFQQLRHLVHPHAVTRVRISGRTVAPEIIHAIWGFFFLYLVVFAVASLALASLHMDLVSATTAVITAMGNCGPGLGVVGPSHTFEALPAAAKWILSACMLLGRLELYTVLVLFLPEYWRR